MTHHLALEVEKRRLYLTQIPTGDYVLTKDQVQDILRGKVESGPEFDTFTSNYVWDSGVDVWCERNNKTPLETLEIRKEVSDLISRAFFGLSIEQVRKYYDAFSQESVRQYIPSRVFEDVYHVEQSIVGRIRIENYDPIEATKASLKTWNVQITDLDS